MGEIIEMGGVQMYTHKHKKYIKLDHKKVGRWCSTSSWQFNCIRESALKKIQIKRNLNCCCFFKFFQEGIFVSSSLSRERAKHVRFFTTTTFRPWMCRVIKWLDRRVQRQPPSNVRDKNNNLGIISLCDWMEKKREISVSWSFCLGVSLSCGGLVCLSHPPNPCLGKDIQIGKKDPWVGSLEWYR